MRHVTYWDLWHDSFICVTWLVDMYDMTYSHMNESGHFPQKSPIISGSFWKNELQLRGSLFIQGGKDSQDPLSCRSFFPKEPIIMGLFCGKWPLKIRDPMSFRHPVYVRNDSNVRLYINGRKFECRSLFIHVGLFSYFWISFHICASLYIYSDFFS